MSILSNAGLVIDHLFEVFALNNAALEKALYKLRNFPNLPGHDQEWVIATLIRNGEVMQLIFRVWNCPETIPTNSVRMVYRAVWADPHTKSLDFLEREQERLTKQLMQEAKIYSNKSMSPAAEDAIVRLAILLKFFGRRGKDLCFRLAKWAYERYRWVPEELDEFISLVRLELPQSDIRSPLRAKRIYDYGKRTGQDVSKRLAFTA